MYIIKLSPYAKLFYTEWLLDPNSRCYNIPIDQILYGNLDVERLKKTFKRYVTEHVILNSHIQDINGEPYWVKNESINSLEYLENPVSTSELLDYVSASFDLYAGPLYRFRLVRVKDGIYRLILVLHHIIVDGSSANLGVYRKLSNYYNDESYASKYSIDRQIELITKLTNELYVKLQQNKNKYKEFWRNQLADIEMVDTRFLKLDDNKKVLSKNNLVTEIRFSYGKTELSYLEQIKHKYKITPYIYGQCILALLLNKYTHQDQFAISYPIAIKEGANFIYGAQINTNLIPCRFNESTKIVDLFNQNLVFFESTIRSDIKYGYYPTADLVQLGDKRALNVYFTQTHLKDQAFIFEGVTKVEISNELNIDSVTPLSFTDWVSPLIFEQDPRSGKLNYRVRYDEKEFNKTLLSDFVVNYQRLFSEVLEDLLHGDNKQVLHYSLLSNEQYSQIIYDWNLTQQNYSQEKTIHELFEEQVGKTPDNIAVIYDNIRLKYQDLNQRADELANYLKHICNLKPKDLVILYLNRGEYIPIAILAVLKAGGVYVPIDPENPQDRLVYVLNDTQANLILTNYDYLSKLKSITKHKAKYKITEILAIDDRELPIELKKQPAISPQVATLGSDLAYVIYTSGTTGQSNGVMIEHSSVINLYYDLTSRYLLGGNEVILQFASYVFDASVEQMVLALLNGHTLLLVPNKLWLDSDLFSSYLINNGVTHIHATPSFLERFNFDGIKTLKRIISGGELFSIALYNHLKSINKKVSIINEYGPTETTVTCMVNSSSKNHHIGRPISNTTAYVLDRNLNPVSIGAIGELYIGGAGLARGYINKPELTKERFIVNPFQTEAEKKLNINNRLYKSGDRVRWLPSGELEYIGRYDSQIKLRGYRIELGEIEAALCNYPGIKQCIALIREHIDINNRSAGNKYLVCYYILTRFNKKQNDQNYVATWQNMYQETYRELKSKAFKENFLGWVSSYTKLPIAYSHMQEWLNDTINRIKSLHPVNVLEIGSGSGLMLFNVIDSCSYYYATDFSAKAISYLQQGVNTYDLHDKVKLLTCRADEVPYNQISSPIDTAVINSVVQYFPNAEYLEKIIQKLITDFSSLLRIFIGDVRDYRLFDVFHHSVQAYRNNTVSQMEIEFYRQRDKELLISPVYFLYLEKSLPRISKIEIFAKECDLTNELSKFRYDLVIYLDTDNANTNTQKPVAYSQFTLVDDIELYLQDNTTSNVLFIKYPRKCVYRDYKLYEIFINKNKKIDIDYEEQNLLSIGQIRQLALRHGLNSKFYLDIYDSIYLNIIFCKLKDNINDFRVIYDDNLPTHELFNNPGKIARMIDSGLSERINRYLNKKLPSYMIPDILINMDQLPLTVNGKLDKTALPQPELIVLNSYVAPRNKTDKKICDLYANILTLPSKQVGINHDFFKLGGNSILAIQLAAKLQHDFKINVADIFVLKTPARIAEFAMFAQGNLLKRLEQIKLNYFEQKNQSSVQHEMESSEEYLRYLKEVEQLVVNKQSKNLRAVVLTGATGHLGCNLLFQLLTESSYQIYLLIRAGSNIEAYDRINEKFKFYFDCGLEKYKERIVVFAANLEKPYLDLNVREYEELVANVDSIIHAAALVKHYGDYDDFYSANVQATINLLELAKSTIGKDFHYVSTIGVFYDGYVPHKNHYIFSELDNANILVGRKNVYAQTKYEGEVITREYREHGVTSNIYRLGNVAMHSKSYRHQENLEENAFFIRIKTMLNLGIIAKEISNVEISPVDFTARAIIKIFDQVNLSNQSYHVFNPHLCDLTELFTATSYLNIKQVTIGEFIDCILGKLNDSVYREQIELFMLHQSWLHESQDIPATQIKVAQDMTTAILTTYNFYWPKITKEMLSDIIKRGFEGIRLNR